MAAGRSRTAAGAEARPEMGGLGRRRECGGGDGDAERQRGDGNGDDAKIRQPGGVDVILALQCSRLVPRSAIKYPQSF